LNDRIENEIHGANGIPLYDEGKMSELTNNIDERIRALNIELRKQDQVIADLQRSEQKYRHFFEKSPAMIYVVDINGKFMNVNRAGVQMLGFSDAEEVIGRVFNDFFFLEDDAVMDYRDIIKQHGAIRDFQTRMRCKSGDIRDVQITAAMRTTVAGKLKGYEGFVIDITKRKIAERKLAESEAKHRMVLENSLTAIYIFQDGGYFSYANPQMVNILGYDHAGEIIGKSFWEMIGEEDRAVVKARGLRREQGEIFPRRYKFRMLRKDGTKIWVDMRSSHAANMGRPAVVGNFIDITKEKNAEEDIRQLSHRLIKVIEEERRALAADLHDEFGQALTLLQLDVAALQNAFTAEQQDAQGLCLKIMEQIQKLAENIRDTTSRLRPDMLDHLGLVPTLQWSIEDFRQRWPDIEIEFQSTGLKRRLTPDTELVLYRVFQEGLNNIGRHAQAKTISVQLTCSHPLVIFIVRDDGVGFDMDRAGLPDNHERLGIGLLSMKERVSSLGGTLLISSVPGKGTTIRVELPINGSQHP
jgi:PAS domain S-box-containing protein